MKTFTKAILAAVTTISLGGIALAQDVIGSDDVPSGHSLQEMAGTYTNAAGDKIIVEVEEAKSNEPDLFNKEYFLYVSVRFANLNNDFEFNPYSLRLENDGSVTVGYEAECQDPGCEEYDLNVNFSRNKSGEYSISSSVDYSKLIDDEGPAEDMAQAKEMCSYFVGKVDQIDVTLNDDQSVNCSFSASDVSLAKSTQP